MTKTRISSVTYLFLSMMVSMLLLSCQETPKPIDNKNQALPKNGQTITIGSKAFTTEQKILMKMSSMLLRNQGFTVKEMVFRDSPSIRKAMEAGAIDLYWEYTSTARIYYHKQQPIFDAEQVYRAVAAEDKKRGLIWLEPTRFNSPWVLVINREMSDRLKIRSISDLAEYANQKDVVLKAAVYTEFMKRNDGINRLQDVYGFSFDRKNLFPIDSKLLSQAVKESRAQLAIGFASDSRIKAYNLVVLEDDRQVFPPYHAAPVIQKKMWSNIPEVERVLKTLTEKMTWEEIYDLNYQVEVLHEDISKVTRQYLEKKGLLSPATS